MIETRRSTTQSMMLEQILLNNFPAIGFPILPGKKNTLFHPFNYLIPNHERLSKEEDDLAAQGRTLEIHYQTVDEFTSLNRAEREAVRAEVARLRGRGFKFMIHHPFLYQNGPGPFEMNYAWHTVPKKYLQEGVFVTQIAGQNNFACEIPLDVSKDFLQYCDFLGIKNVTIHATKPGNKLDDYFDEAEFANYSAKMGELTSFIREQGLNVQIAVETGGITLPQLLTLNKEHGTLITYDLAHFFLDLGVWNPEMTIYEKNVAVVDTFREHRDIIRQLHFTQTTGGDAHHQLHRRGLLSKCNIEVLQLMRDDLRATGAKRREYLAMIESSSTEKDDDYALEEIALKERIGYPGAGQAIVNVVLGDYASGKSDVSSVLKEVIGPVADIDRQRLSLRDTSSPELTFSREADVRVYPEHYSRLVDGLKVGNPQTNIEATFHLPSTRKTVYDLLRENPAQDVYFWNVTCSEDDRKQRLDFREGRKSLAETIGEGAKFPTNILISYDHYTRLMNPSGDAEKPLPFHPSEIPIELRDRVHVVTYNTSTHKIETINPDDRTRQVVSLLLAYSSAHGHGPVRGSVVVWP